MGPARTKKSDPIRMLREGDVAPFNVRALYDQRVLSCKTLKTSHRYNQASELFHLCGGSQKMPTRLSSIAFAAELISESSSA